MGVEETGNAGSEPAPSAVEPLVLEFGNGKLVVGTVRIGSHPQHFVAINPAVQPGPVGEITHKREQRDTIIGDEVLMSFPTFEQASRVMDAICNVTPAPSVAVKALEWRIGSTQHRQVASVFDRPMYEVGIDNGRWYWLHNWNGLALRRVDSENEALAAAQADYEARILSALSAQVQDVAMPEAQDMQLFGHWSKHRLADGAFLPMGCYVPEGPDYTTIPLYRSTSAQGHDVAEYEADRLRRMVERRDEFIISKGLWNDFKEAYDEAS